MILLFKFVQIIHEFSYYIKMRFIWVLSHSFTISFSSNYLFHTDPHHCQLLVIFITMVELFLSPKLSHRTQPSGTRKVSNTRPTSSALGIWAEIHPLNNPIRRCNHHSFCHGRCVVLWPLLQTVTRRFLLPWDQTIRTEWRRQLFSRAHHSQK
jgi:hypothetical protein